MTDQHQTETDEAARLAQAREDLHRAVELTCSAVLMGGKPDTDVEHLGRLNANDVFAHELDGVLMAHWDLLGLGGDATDDQMNAAVQLVEDAFWFGLTAAHAQVTRRAFASRRLFPSGVPSR